MEESSLPGRTLDERSVDFAELAKDDNRSKTRFMRLNAISCIF